jgi:hypothetical protein
MANWAWLAPKPRNAPHTGLLVRTAIASMSMVGTTIGAAGVAGGPFQHLHPHRGVGPGVAHHAGRSAVSLPSASQPARTRCGSGGAWRASAATPRASERALDRPPSRWAARAVWPWLLMSSLPPKAPPLETSSVLTRSVGTPRIGDLVAVVPDALPARVHVEPAVVAGLPGWTPVRGRRARPAGSGTPRAPCDADDARAASTSPRAYFDTDSTLPSRPHTASSSEVEGGHRVGEGRMHLVVDLDQLGRRAGGGEVVGDDDGQHVAQVAGAPAHGDEHRPVLVDEPHLEVAGDVGCGVHSHHPGHGEAAAEVSIETMSARAWSVRRRAPCSMPGTRRSSM